MSSRLSIANLSAVPPLHGAALVVGLGALGALATALGFEHLGGYDPCPLCLIERWAYYGAIPAGFLALFLANGGQPAPARLLLAACAIGFIANAGLGLYHSGVEWKWWPGPETCSGNSAAGFAIDNLQQSLEQARVVRCDEAPWRLFGLSFAGWSGVISAGLAVIGIYGVRAGRGSA